MYKYTSETSGSLMQMLVRVVVSGLQNRESSSIVPSKNPVSADYHEV